MFAIKSRKLEIAFKANYKKNSIIVLFHINSLLWLLFTVTFFFSLIIHRNQSLSFCKFNWFAFFNKNYIAKKLFREI